MSYILAQYWIFIALAFVLGLYVGWAGSAAKRAERGWAAAAALTFACGLELAWLEVVPGLLGHVLEVALLLFGGYLVGCAIGSFAEPPRTGDRGEAA